MGRTFYYKGIQLPQLRSFCSVALEGSFTAAARVLNLSKPTVWQQVRALEREMGVTLLNQNGRRVELTAEGQLLLGLIQPHVSGLDSLVRLFETQRTQLQQRLTVASTPYLISHRLPKPIQTFTTEHPTVRLHLRDDLYGETVLRYVDQGQVDLGIVPYLPSEPRNPYLDYEDLFELEFTLLTSSRHPLARQRKVTPQDLVRYPIIRGASYNLRMLESLLQQHNVIDRLHVIMESGSTDIILKYVALGIGIALVYMGRDEVPPKGVSVRAFTQETPNLVVALIRRRGAHLPQHVQEFRATVRRHLAKDPPAFSGSNR